MNSMEQEALAEEELLREQEAHAHMQAQESFRSDNSDNELVSLDEPARILVNTDSKEVMGRRARKTANKEQKKGEVDVLRNKRPTDQTIAERKLDDMEDIYASQTKRPHVPLKFDNKSTSCVFAQDILRAALSQAEIENLHIIINDGMGYVKRFYKVSSRSESASYYDRIALLERYFTSSDAYIVIFPAGIVFISTDREYMESHYFWKQMMGLTLGYEKAAGVYNRQMYFGDPMKNNIGPMIIVCMMPARKVHLFCETTLERCSLFDTSVDDRAMIDMPGGYRLEKYPKDMLTRTDDNNFLKLIQDNLWGYVPV